MRRTLHIFLLLFPFFFVLSCGKNQENALLERLDDVLKYKSSYDMYFSDRADELYDILMEQENPEQQYSLAMRISQIYRTHSFDSSLFYLNMSYDIAGRLGDEDKMMSAKFAMIKLYSLAGYHIEASDLLENYAPESVPDTLMREYCEASHVFYGETMAYSSSDEMYKEKGALRDHYRDLLLEMVEKESVQWYDLKREEAEIAHDEELTREYARQMVSLTQENTPEYARACYFYSLTYPEDSPEKEEWLIRSAIADLMCSTRDYESLNSLSRIYFERGDINRAFRYAADHCMKDALEFNGKLRTWQVSLFLPEIEQAYLQKNRKQKTLLANMIVVMSALGLLLLIMLIYTFKRQQILDSMRRKLQESYLQIDKHNQALVAINSRLTSLNAKIQEADKVKQEYIALFLSILSENINTTRKYKHHVLKSIRQGNTGALIDEIEALPPIEEDIIQFYKMFDQTFVNLYPDFVEKFNDLLVDGAAIIPKGDDILTPELRIFALIKLGINDSSKIASLLHYSSNTIYNYRSKTKNKARCSREDFEEAVRNIE